MNEYKNFSVEDFLKDEAFIRWAQDPSAGDCEFWEKWLESNPEKVEVVESAKQLIIAFKSQPRIPDDFFSRLKTRIDTSVNEGDNKRSRTISFAVILKMVAVFIGLIIGTVAIYRTLSKAEFLTYKTNFAETKKVVLPDGSEVLLNANSYLKYKVSKNKDDREAWLRGEAFFNIKHFEDGKHDALKFIVHAKNLAVEVLGTQFNINDDDTDKTEVLLTKGKVRLSVNEGDIQPIIMKPDDFVAYNNKTKNVSLQKVSPANYIAWTDHKYVLEKTTLDDISKELYQYYGTPITFRDPEMRSQRLSGTLELQDEETLIRTLSTLLGVPVNKVKNQIIIGSN